MASTSTCWYEGAMAPLIMQAVFILLEEKFFAISLSEKKHLEIMVSTHQPVTIERCAAQACGPLLLLHVWPRNYYNTVTLNNIIYNTCSVRGLDCAWKLSILWSFQFLVLAWCIAFPMRCWTSCFPWWSQATCRPQTVQRNLYGSPLISHTNG